MAARARNLVAGMLAATAMSAGAATSFAQDTVVVSNQVQLGDVFAEQTLNVVDVEEQTTAVTTATGNALSGAVEGGTLTLTSTQDMQGDATAQTTLNIAGSNGQVTILTEAVANTGDAGAYGADMTATVTQTAGAVEITANSDVAGPTAYLNDGGAVSATALANSQAFGLSDGSTSSMTVTQSSAALAEAEVEAVVQYMPDTAIFSAAATSNNVSTSGSNGTSQLLVVDQAMTGPRTQSTAFVSAANAWMLEGSAAAVGNNVAAINEHGSLEVDSTQSNASTVRADAIVLSYDYGLASAQATGVGNSMLAGNNGQYVEIDNAQFNSGGVEVNASFAGNGGYDSYVTSTAIGNAATGYACSECQGTLIARSSQTNTNGVSATSTVDITGSGRSITGTATAVGNSSSFWVSSPGG